jgi:hypothetical protein
LNDLVEIVASQSGKSAKSEDLDLQTELNMVIKTIENQIRNSGAEIVVNFEKDLKIHFPGIIFIAYWLTCSPMPLNTNLKTEIW